MKMKNYFWGLLFIFGAYSHGMDRLALVRTDSFNSIEDFGPELLYKKVLFTPKDDISLALQEMIARENCHINIMMYNFTDSKIAEALVAARHRGVTMTLIVDISSMSYPSSLHALSAAGVRMLVYNPHGVLERDIASILVARDRSKWPLMHNKSWIFFRNYDDQRLIVTGSYNATLAVGTWHNEENVILSDVSEVFDGYRDQFYDLSKQCTDLAEFH